MFFVNVLVSDDLSGTIDRGQITLFLIWLDIYSMQINMWDNDILLPDWCPVTQPSEPSLHIYTSLFKRVALELLPE